MNVFDKSIFIEPGKVLGKDLLPFSAFHASCLALVESPLLSAGLPAWGDLVTAVLICTSRKKDGLSKYLRFTNSKLYRLYWRIKIMCHKKSKVIDQIVNHISAYYDFPDVGEKAELSGKKSTARSGAPGFHFIVSAIWQSTGARLNDIWDMPLCELACHKAMQDEMGGGVEISTSLLEERERNRVEDGS